MGYSHYWKATEPLVVLPLQTKLLQEVLKENKKLLFGGMGKGKPELTDSLLCFNGNAKTDEDHETFSVEFGKAKNFDFCKTAQKPYDLAVCKCLLVLSLSKGFSFSSDGDLSDWEEAIDWFKEKGFADTLEKKILSYFNGN